jgi:ATP-dependent Clp protease protease subunit
MSGLPRAPGGVGPQPGPREPGGQSGQLRCFDRTLVVTGSLDDALAGDLAAHLMTLDAVSGEPIRLQLNLIGTTVEAALAVMDVIDLVSAPVEATCIGRVEGAAVGVLAVADHRLIGAHARVRMIEPSAEIAGRASDLALMSATFEGQLEQFHARLATAVGRPLEHVEADARVGRYFDAEQARAYGLVDAVV